MSDSALRARVIRLAHSKPEFRAYLLPMLKKAGQPSARQKAALRGVGFPDSYRWDGVQARWIVPDSDKAQGQVDAVLDAAARAGFKPSAPPISNEKKRFGRLTSTSGHDLTYEIEFGRKALLIYDFKG